MIIKKFDNNEEWLEYRIGKITGSRLKNVVTYDKKPPKVGFYELIAERLAVPPDDENPMMRGHRLEKEALELFSKEIDEKIDNSLIMWIDDENDKMAVSPDGVIDKRTAVEVKCLSSARHLETLLTNKTPTEYKYQIMQYFIINKDLETLYMVFYDPRLSVRSLFHLIIKRENIEKDIEKYTEYQIKMLKEVDDIVLRLSF